MLRFRQMKTVQKFSSAHAAFHNHFNRDRHLISRETYKAQRSAALAEEDGGGGRRQEVTKWNRDSDEVLAKANALRPSGVKA
ncbi:MAG: hypothetical protein ACXWVS_00080 [Hyphomicrobium sp.]